MSSSICSINSCYKSGADPGGVHPARAPPLKLKKYDFLWQNRDFSHEIPQKFSRLPPLSAIDLDFDEISSVKMLWRYTILNMVISNHAK